VTRSKFPSSLKECVATVTSAVERTLPWLNAAGKATAAVAARKETAYRQLSQSNTNAELCKSCNHIASTLWALCVFCVISAISCFVVAGFGCCGSTSCGSTPPAQPAMQMQMQAVGQPAMAQAQPVMAQAYAQPNPIQASGPPVQAVAVPVQATVVTQIAVPVQATAVIKGGV